MSKLQLVHIFGWRKQCSQSRTEGWVMGWRNAAKDGRMGYGGGWRNTGSGGIPRTLGIGCFGLIEATAGLASSCKEDQSWRCGTEESKTFTIYCS